MSQWGRGLVSWATHEGYGLTMLWESGVVRSLNPVFSDETASVPPPVLSVFI